MTTGSALDVYVGEGVGLFVVGSGVKSAVGEGVPTGTWM
eukprot:CAMPEP_0197048354 /NCGR_PEP_ID=MMETSP1384-20130603/23732_1 /TAXON_ID=29189 /ORGANISM="Ammonia sp." /LENGTH=38 /DNA_ID= /DNA_START= /DNA_END= /DNA_ORIENTATION=